ncbi:hypothetical protein BB558_005163 [Smittium angustum]|uniref:glucan 1,4-alpha-glucosidase n=1 Tax=Smittium angustum TaxID=133377 RepID=A0A2U1J1C1_SMIAN|nr:hypothetical protein BB558_005163 [Smittium angustum]
MKVIPSVISRGLSEKLYDKRKVSALQLESLVKELISEGNIESISNILTELSDEFIKSLKESSRSGGVMGIATCAIALGHERIANYLDLIVPGILKTLSDAEPRVRYYGCEALYNVAKVARGLILGWFNEIMDALSKVTADPSTSVKESADYVDRLIKDVVTEEATSYAMNQNSKTFDTSDHPFGYEQKQISFSLERLMPLISERMHTFKAATRLYLIEWIRILDSIPGLDLIKYLPSFLDQLLRFLSDPKDDVRLKASNALSELLREVEECAGVQELVDEIWYVSENENATKGTEKNNKKGEKIVIPQRKHSSAGSDIFPTVVAASEELRMAARRKKIRDERREIALHSPQNTNTKKSGQLLRGYEITVDHAACLNILIGHLQSNDQEIQSTSLGWVGSFSYICPKELVGMTPQLVKALLPLLSHSVPIICKMAYKINKRLQHLVYIQSSDLFEYETNYQVDTDNLTPLIRSNSSLQKSAFQPVDNNTNSLDNLFVEDDVRIPYLDSTKNDSNQLHELFSHQKVVNEIMVLFANNVHEATKVEGLRWLLLLHKTIPHHSLSPNGINFSFLLKILSDSSEKVVYLSLKLFAQIALYSEKQDASGDTYGGTYSKYLARFIGGLLQIFITDRELLRQRMPLVVRQLCLVLNPERVFKGFSIYLHKLLVTYKMCPESLNSDNLTKKSFKKSHANHGGNFRRVSSVSGFFGNTVKPEDDMILECDDTQLPKLDNKFKVHKSSSTILEDIEFGREIVQQLTWILICAPETAKLREMLRTNNSSFKQYEFFSDFKHYRHGNTFKYRISNASNEDNVFVESGYEQDNDAENVSDDGIGTELGYIDKFPKESEDRNLEKQGNNNNNEYVHKDGEKYENDDELYIDHSRDSVLNNVKKLSLNENNNYKQGLYISQNDGDQNIEGHLHITHHSSPVPRANQSAQNKSVADHSATFIEASQSNKNDHGNLNNLPKIKNKQNFTESTTRNLNQPSPVSSAVSKLTSQESTTDRLYRGTLVSNIPNPTSPTYKSQSNWGRSSRKSLGADSKPPLLPGMATGYEEERENSREVAAAGLEKGDFGHEYNRSDISMNVNDSSIIKTISQQGPNNSRFSGKILGKLPRLGKTVSTTTNPNPSASQNPYPPQGRRGHGHHLIPTRSASPLTVSPVLASGVSKNKNTRVSGIREDLSRNEVLGFPSTESANKITGAPEKQSFGGYGGINNRGRHTSQTGGNRNNYVTSRQSHPGTSNDDRKGGFRSASANLSPKNMLLFSYQQNAISLDVFTELKRKNAEKCDCFESQPKNLFETLFWSWSCCPVSTLILCLMSQQYKLSYSIVNSISQGDISVSLLKRLDQVVQLLESPVFAFLRMQLLRQNEHPFLMASLYGILMILPQSVAFVTLRNRLMSVSNIQLFQNSNILGSIQNTLGNDETGIGAGSELGLMNQFGTDGYNYRVQSGFASLPSRSCDTLFQYYTTVQLKIYELREQFLKSNAQFNWDDNFYKALYPKQDKQPDFGEKTRSENRNGQKNTKEIELEKWIETQYKTSVAKIWKNVSPIGSTHGAICASPSNSNPDYFYHWIRDSALTASFLVKNLQGQKNSLEYSEKKRKVNDFVSFSQKLVSKPHPIGGFGEPKYNMDGSYFMSEWGRPQNDGPALRAISLIQYANHLISMNQNISNLYCKEGCIINQDLDFVMKNMNIPGFEIWEEVKGIHYYTLVVQLKSLEMGSKLAQTLGDSKSSSLYINALKSNLPELEKFWDSKNQIILSTINWSGGLQGKLNNLDSQVILALIHTWDNNTLFYNPNIYSRTISTLLELVKVFVNEYKINQLEIPGIAMGRYPKDKYNGYNSDFEGNPWPLITSGVAELYYKMCIEILEKKTVKLDKKLIDALSVQSTYKTTNLKHSFDAKDIGKTLNVQNKRYWDILDALFGIGEDFLERLKYHTSHDGSMSEQWNRNTGFNQGAPDLTWSYTAFCTMINARNHAKTLLQKLKN